MCGMVIMNGCLEVHMWRVRVIWCHVTIMLLEQPRADLQTSDGNCQWGIQVIGLINEITSGIGAVAGWK